MLLRTQDTAHPAPFQAGPRRERGRDGRRARGATVSPFPGLPRPSVPVVGPPSPSFPCLPRLDLASRRPGTLSVFFTGPLAFCWTRTCVWARCGGQCWENVGPVQARATVLTHPPPALLQVGSHRLSIYEEWDPFRFRHMIPTEALQVRTLATAGENSACRAGFPRVRVHAPGLATVSVLN